MVFVCSRELLPVSISEGLTAKKKMVVHMTLENDRCIEYVFRYCNVTERRDEMLSTTILIRGKKKKEW